MFIMFCWVRRIFIFSYHEVSQVIWLVCSVSLFWCNL